MLLLPPQLLLLLLLPLLLLPLLSPLWLLLLLLPQVTSLLRFVKNVAERGFESWKKANILLSSC